MVLIYLHGLNLHWQLTSASIVTLLSWVTPGHGRKLNDSQGVLAVAILGMDKGVGRAGSREDEARKRGGGESKAGEGYRSLEKQQRPAVNRPLGPLNVDRMDLS